MSSRQKVSPATFDFDVACHGTSTAPDGINVGADPAADADDDYAALAVMTLVQTPSPA